MFARYTIQNLNFSTQRLIAVVLLAHLALSWPLWYAGAGRTFPMLPVWGEAYLPEHFRWEGLQIGLFLLVLAAIGIFPQKRYAAPVLAVALLWMVAQDLNRLQPWTYFYLLALGLLFFSKKNTPGALRWLLAAVYCWGGLNKITPYFAEDNFPWFCEAFAWTKPFGAFPALGYAAAAELLLAPGLLWPPTRPVFRWLAVAFHVFIIAALCPLGLDWNAVVIPWNVAMAGMVWMCGAAAPKSGWTTEMQRLGGSDFSSKTTLRRCAAALRGTGVSAVLLALAWLFPALNIAHLWPEPLAWKMYSNTQPEAGFFSENGPPCPGLQAVWNKHAYDAGTKLLFDDWAFDNLQVPAYNSPHTHRQLAQYLCRCTPRPEEAGWWRLTVQRWNRSGEKLEKIRCAAEF